MGKKWTALLCLFAMLLTLLPAAAEDAGETALPEEYAEYRLIARSDRYEMYLYDDPFGEAEIVEWQGICHEDLMELIKRYKKA